MKIGGKSILFEYKPIGYVQSPLCELAIFGISSGDFEDVSKHFRPLITGNEPTTLIRRVLPLILHKKNQLKEDGSKPETPTLTEEEIRALPNDVIDAALEQFIEANPHLNKRTVSRVTQNEKGESVTAFSYGDVKHPKKENETNVQYLHRLIGLHEEETKRQMERLLGTAHFSHGLSQSIKDTLQLGNSINAAIEALRPTKMPDFSTWNERVASPPTLPITPPKDYSKIASEAEQARTAPFNALNERLDTLIELTEKTSGFTVQMNQTQTQISAEIKASGEEASRIGNDSLKLANSSLKIADDSFQIAKRGFWIAVIAVLLTLAGFWFPAQSWWNSDDESERADRRAEQIVNGLTDVRSEIADRGQLSARDISAMIAELKSARAEQFTKLESILNTQVELLNRQDKLKGLDHETIESLRDRIGQLENQLRNLQSSTTAPSQ